jgi:hypothetical protein
LRNTCSECGREFSSDLRFCPRCKSPAKRANGHIYKYGAPTMVRETTVDKDAEKKCYRQNGYVLLCCFILLTLPIYMAVDGILDWFSEKGFDWYVVLLAVYGVAVVLLVFYGLVKAWMLESPGAQILAAILIWVHTTFVHTLVFILSGFVIALIWGIAASKTGSFMRPDPSYLVVLSGIALMDILWMYTWLYGSTMGLG